MGLTMKMSKKDKEELLSDDLINVCSSLAAEHDNDFRVAN